MNNNSKYSYIKNLRLAFSSITIYRDLLNDPVIERLRSLIDYLSFEPSDLSKAVDLYSDLVHNLSKTQSFKSVSLRKHLILKLLFSDNMFSRLCENSDSNPIDKSLLSSVSKELFLIEMISDVSSDTIKELLINNCNEDDFTKKVICCLPAWDENSAAKYPLSSNESIASMEDLFNSAQSWSELTEALCSFYRQNGCGEFAQYNAFVWERDGSRGFLRGISCPDPIRLSDLVGYESERGEVIENTMQLLKGYHANNMLLYGDRGTGKSSTVKAILNEYSHQGLRLIEVPKMHLSDFHIIIRMLKDRKQKFIIFVDDLVFEDNEENYTTLKAVLEGGIEPKPENVVIYATSNRRHLIKEKFSDRIGLQSSNQDDEIRAADTIQEKLSLSDRFGITVVFSSPDKKKYLQIVEGIAAKRGLKYSKEYLEREALKWEMWYNGRSPRTARQFVDWLEGQST